jgi:UDP-4-amino-4,6-dideoxy-N-acetyl-beta-L-altrosamine transaminase
MIPYARQSISDDDVNSVVSVLKSDFLTQGPQVPLFEQAVAEYVGSKYCVAVNSATSGLHIACLALGIGSGDVVWTSVISFVASANCARMCGAEIGFVDIDPQTMNLSSEDLRQKLEDASRSDRLPKCLIVVHMAGQPADMHEIAELCAQYSVLIIEDASHALGAEYRGERVGSCSYSSATVFSFHPVKLITTGEGGAVTTNSHDIARCMEMIRSHGITRDHDEFVNPTPEPWAYEQQLLGFNYRLSDFSAALGHSQLLRLDQFVRRRNEIADRYIQLFADCEVVLPKVSANRKSSFHLFVVQVDFAKKEIDKARFFQKMKTRGISLNVHYRPICDQPYYQDLGFSSSEFPIARSYYQAAVSLPMYADLTDEQCEFVVKAMVDELETSSNGGTS